MPKKDGMTARPRSTTETPSKHASSSWGHGLGGVRTAIMSRRHAYPALEGATEGCLGAVPDSMRDFREARVTRAQQGCRELNAPLREILNRRNAHEIGKTFRQHRAGHAHVL